MSWQLIHQTEAEEAQVVIKQAARYYGVSPADVTGGRRFVELVQARHAVCLMLRDRGWPYKKIGRLMGMDHTSVIHACTKDLPIDRIAGVGV